MYVIYDTENNVTSITNVMPINGNYLEVALEEVEPFFQGKDNYLHYQVKLNPKTTLLELTPKTDYEEDAFDINQVIYEVPTTQDTADLSIVQDCPNKCWKFFPSTELKNGVATQNFGRRIDLFFSVTKLHNPNILYRQLIVRFDKLLQEHYFIVDFKYPFEFEGTDISVFTNKRFNSYNYKKINNE